VWTKAEFIKYYNDDASDRPVRWTFLGSGADFHVMLWAPGDALSQAHWQAPDYCFNGKACGGEGPDAVKCPPSVLDVPLATGRLMRMPQPAPSAVGLGVQAPAGGAARQAKPQLGARTGGRAAASLKR
jgi:hypothetical protein